MESADKEMSRHNEVESLIYKMKLISQLVWLWPIDPNSIIIVRVLKNFGWFLWSMSMFPRTLSLLFDVYYNADKACVILVKTLSTLFLNLEIFFALLFWKCSEKKHNDILHEIISFVQSCESDEDGVFNKNLRSYIPACIFNAVFCGILTICFCCGPLFLPDTILPIAGWYPFSIDLYTPRYYVIYTVLVCETARVAWVSSAFPIIYMLYFSYAITKIQLLCTKFKMVHNEQELHDCIDEHKKCIRFVTQLNSAVRFILLAKYSTTIMVSIFTGLIIILDHTFLSIFRSGLFVLLSLMQIYFPTWYADNLYTSSQEISQAIYNSQWTSSTVKMRKSMLITMFRAQKGLSISVSGFMPKLTKTLFASFLSMVLSYYMALRVLFR